MKTRFTFVSVLGYCQVLSVIY